MKTKFDIGEELYCLMNCVFCVDGFYEIPSTSERLKCSYCNNGKTEEILSFIPKTISIKENGDIVYSDLRLMFKEQDLFKTIEELKGSI